MLGLLNIKEIKAVLGYRDNRAVKRWLNCRGIVLMRLGKSHCILESSFNDVIEQIARNSAGKAINLAYITYSYKEFEIHFIHDKLPSENIIWPGEVMGLVFLFDTLVFDKKIMPPVNNLYNMFCNHFNVLEGKKRPPM